MNSVIENFRPCANRMNLLFYLLYLDFDTNIKLDLKDLVEKYKEDLSKEQLDILNLI